jgi:hypothetical protein
MLRFRLRGPSAAGRRARLSLETLDGRVLLDATPLDQPSPSPTGDTSPAPVAPPQITGFTATEVSTGLYLFSGTVVADHPEGMTVTFGGAPVSLEGKTTTVLADGTFSLLVSMQTDGSDDGTATAVCTDEYGQVSNTATTLVTPSH